jgi:hypothetical protein
MFAAYFDESGIHQSSEVVAVAGYLASVAQWNHFQRNWSDMLTQESIKCFHMTDLESLKGEFEGWNKARQIRVIQKAHTLINVRKEIGVAAAVAVEDHSEVAARVKSP